MVPVIRLCSHITPSIGCQWQALVAGCPVWDEAMNHPVLATAGSRWGSRVLLGMGGAAWEGGRTHV